MKLTVVFTLLVCAACAVGLLALRSKRIVSYRDRKVTAGEIMRPIDRLAPHLSKKKYLTIGNDTFTGIRGLPPYYLDLTNLNCILFVTADRRAAVTFWIAGLTSNHITRIDGGD